MIKLGSNTIDRLYYGSSPINKVYKGLSEIYTAVSLPGGDVFTSANTIGSSVSIVNQSPFISGGNSYNFITSTNSYISINANNSWVLGTNDFTIEWFSYQTSLTNFQRVFTIGDYPTITIGVSIETAGNFYYWANSNYRYNANASSTINTWYHWAVVRQSGITKVYRNGNILGSQIVDTNNINNITNLIIGNTNTFANNAAFQGYITNFRWVKELAVYTGNFTVPTSSLTLTATANPYGGSNTSAIPSGYTKLLLVP